MCRYSEFSESIAYYWSFNDCSAISGESEDVQWNETINESGPRKSVTNKYNNTTVIGVVPSGTTTVGVLAV